MNIKNICLSFVIMLAAAMLCSCSSEEGSSRAAVAVIFIFLFLGASLCSAVLTFKLRRKKNSENNEELCKKE